MASILEVILNLVDNLSGDLQGAASNVEDFSSTVDAADAALESIDPGQIPNIEQAAMEAGLEVADIQEAAAFAASGINGIDPSSLQDTSNAAKDAGDGLEGAADSANILEGAVAALISYGIVEWLEGAADAAGQFEDKWLRLSTNLGTVSGDVDGLRQQYGGAISQMQEDTGRGLGAILSTMNELGVAGIQSGDMMTQSFDAIAGASFSTEQSIDSITSRYKRMVMAQTFMSRSLVQLGISDQDVLRATGMTVDELKNKWKTLSVEQRAALLNQILNSKHGQDSNEAYKRSWEHVTDALQRAQDAIVRIAGSFLLPILIPAIEAVTGILSAFAEGLKSIPSPIKTIIGAVMLLVGGLISLMGFAVAANSLLGALGISIFGLGGATTAGGAALAALSAALGPVGIAIMAIIAIIITATYIWTTWHDKIIELKDALFSGDWGSAAKILSDSFKYAGSTIWNALTNIGQQVWNFFAGLPAWLGNAASSWIQLGRSFINWLISGLLSLASSLQSTIVEMLNPSEGAGGAGEAGKGAGEAAGKGLIEGFIEWINNNGPMIIQNVVDLFFKIIPLLMVVIGQIITIIAIYLWQGAQTAGSQFVNALVSWFAQLPGRIWGFLLMVLNNLAFFAGYALGYAIKAGYNITMGVIQFLMTLPARAWSYFLSTLARIRNFASQAPGIARQAGSQIVSGLIGAITGLPGKVMGILNQIASRMMGIGGTLYNAARNLGAQIWNGFKAGLGIASPSYLERAMDAIIAKSHEMPGEMMKDAEALRRINWEDASPLMNLSDSALGSGPAPTITIDDKLDLNLNVDLQNVPDNIDEATVIEILKQSITDSALLKQLIKNRNFIDILQAELGRATVRNKRKYGV